MRAISRVAPSIGDCAISTSRLSVRPDAIVHPDLEARHLARVALDRRLRHLDVAVVGLRRQQRGIFAPESVRDAEGYEVAGVHAVDAVHDGNVALLAV